MSKEEAIKILEDARPELEIGAKNEGEMQQLSQAVLALLDYVKSL